ncbi:MAG TPA: hypothetical protein VH092_38290 [Urbifossiella sp.]|nr:hypothetical protein [Urbifossiella sp.]
MELPVGLDYAWLACDADGCVARFMNAGEGPVPVVVLANRGFADQADALARGLPFVGGCEMRVRLPDPTDYSRIARRGLFGFDWQDATRTAGRSDRYEIVSRPLRRLRIEELPPELRKLAELVRFEGLRFADSSSIDVGRLVE